MWTLYLLLCRDQTLYTGITTNLSSRLQAHNLGKGAKYTRGRGPVKVVWSEVNLTQSQARRREAEMKKLTRAQKWLLVHGD